MNSDKSIVEKIPLLKTNAGPKELEWEERLKEEFTALIEYVKINQEDDSEWFEVNPIDSKGLKWEGKCWYFHNFEKYEFKLKFEIPSTYPSTPIELELPELDGKTPKMYRGGKICLDIHFSPLWSKKTPKFGIAHALALALGPWLAAEIPYLVDEGIISV